MNDRTWNTTNTDPLKDLQNYAQLTYNHDIATTPITGNNAKEPGKYPIVLEEWQRNATTMHFSCPENLCWVTYQRT
jgi:hypothetical protein